MLLIALLFALLIGVSLGLLGGGGSILMEGLVVGAVTGLVGAGGGFLVVPALVLLGPIVRAIPLLQGESRLGWLVLLDDAGAASEGPVSFHGMWTQSPKLKQIFRVI
jgi:hypothetical protein